MMATKSNGHGMGVEKGSAGFRTTVIAKLFEYFDYKGWKQEALAATARKPLPTTVGEPGDHRHRRGSSLRA